MLANNILTNGNHPSIIVWSIANELNSTSGRRRAPTSPRRPHAPTGWTRRAPSGWPSPATRAAGCQPRYAPLDVLGINEYFGWYPGPNGSIADRSLLSDYLDQVHACYPNKALVVTETGAEANRDGPAEEKGHLRSSSGLRQLPLRRLRDEAVAVGRDLLGAAGVPRAPELGRRQPAARSRRSTRRA